MAARAAGRRFLCAFIASVASSGALAQDTGTPSNRPDFEILFSGDARLQSFTYARPGPDNWIDTTVGVSTELLRYRSTFLLFRFENETDMGKGEQFGIFDPNRGRWTFDLGTRTEFSGHFFEVWMRHDCYHGIDRFLPGQDYKMTSEGVGFGSLGYLVKYRLRHHDANVGLTFPFKLDYYVNPMAYAPHGDPWQRHPYRWRVGAEVRLHVLSWRWIGLELETLNNFYYTASSTFQRAHVLRADAIVYGAGAAMMAFAAWWPYDDQVFRNRSEKVVFGLELNL